VEKLKEKRAPVLYVSSLMTPGAFAASFPDLSRAPGIAQQKYHRLLTAGLYSAGAEVSCLSAPPLTRANTGKLFCRVPAERAEGISFRYLPVLALPGVKHLVTLAAAFFAALARCKRGSLMLCDGLNLTVSAGSRAAAKLRHAKAVAIVTDVPGMQGGGKLHCKLNLALLRRFDGYVLLTEQMNSLVNPKGRPHLVAEGQVDPADAARPPQLAEKSDPPVVLYAGSLHKEYGILRLAEAFMQLSVQAELHIYGAGNAAEALRALAKGDARIRLFGVRDNAEVVRAERSATLLVNPRPSDGAFTPYSFPSKNMEYMASGTPVLTARLPGMPAEYGEHAFVLDDETPAGMAEALKRILALPPQTLLEKGEGAQTFVRMHKTGAAQAARILNFFTTI